ncbi:riboflavin synthase [Flaviflagellibacter deserti]|jgi:riboflavin synthase|uniref:Riboflavin synthase n=1 Tax=Flaviflagellibacter deserti TaxID=2267266 RepID=A0ABV9YYQ6_9HYPH
MFTGIVTDIGEVLETEVGDAVTRLTVGCRYERKGIDIGASIACSGVCLTVVETGELDGRTLVKFDAAPETLAVTTAALWRTGTRLNLERALKVGDELGGHIVAGHVDGTASILSRDEIGDAVRFGFETAPELARFIATKGSVCLDGVSLTVNAVDGTRFSVLLIPHTLAVTTLGDWKPGDAVNLEVDLMARYAARLAEASGVR